MLKPYCNAALGFRVSGIMVLFLPWTVQTMLGAEQGGHTRQETVITAGMVVSGREGEREQRGR